MLSASQNLPLGSIGRLNSTIKSNPKFLSKKQIRAIENRLERLPEAEKLTVKKELPRSQSFVDMATAQKRVWKVPNLKFNY